MKKKTVALILALVMVFGAAVGGTIAYLTSTDSVKNTFTVGKVAIDLWETDNTKTDGTKTHTGNTYDKIVPNHTYAKDPTVTVKAGSEESFVRMLVTIDKKAALDEIGFNMNEVFVGYDAAKWAFAGEKDNDDDTMTYEFRYATTVTGGDEDIDLPALFTGVKVPGTLTNEQLASIDGLQINVVAQAIQADGFNTADAAWAAFNG